MATAGIYVHIPFCASKCGYCDFASWPGRRELHGPYAEALLSETRRAGRTWPGPGFDTLYTGGGTPTVLEPAALVRILETCRLELGLAADAETTCEANPGTVTRTSLAALRRGGFTRLSVGVQSLHDDELALLGRTHDRQAALDACAAARDAGFGNVSLDLIYALPHQSLERWRESLMRALELGPEHLSLYALTLEEGTPLAGEVACGALPAPDDDLAADMYALAQAMLAEAGYGQYEVSNWARRSAGDDADGEPALASRHNLHYWRGDAYLGLGAAAVSYDGRSRYGRVRDPEEYVRRVERGDDTVKDREPVDRDRAMDESMMLGLRLSRGVRWAEFSARFGVDLRAVYAAELDTVERTGLVVVDAVGIRLRPEAFIVSNRVLSEFLR